MINIMLDHQKPPPLEFLSSEEEKPFKGRYHDVLRPRKGLKQQLVATDKKEYKKKKISLKDHFWAKQILKIQAPLSQYHVYNFHNILAINQHSLLDPHCEQSFVSSKFYMKKINKVTIRKGCFFLTMDNVPNLSAPIPYLCERLKSLGNEEYWRLAETVQHMQNSFPQINRKICLQDSMQTPKLDEFLQEMGDRAFFSQYSPELLIISSSFLKILGYDLQEFALQTLKYKTITREFFSSEHYCRIVKKHLENIQLLGDYFQGKMSLNQFCHSSQIEFDDVIYNRLDKMVKCNFFGATSRQLIPYLIVRQLNELDEEKRPISCKNAVQRQKIEQFSLNCRKKEYQILKNIIDLPKHLDPLLRGKICGYKLIDGQQWSEVALVQ